MQIDKRLQSRDLEVIRLVEECKICTRSQIQKVIFKHIDQSVCIRRLRLLNELKLLSRARFNIEEKSNQFVYYPYKTKKPSKKLLHHDLMVTEFIISLYVTGVEVLEVERVSPIGNIIPDACILIKTSEGKTKRLLLEVQLSGKLEDCILKYKRIKENILENKPKWMSIPTLIVVSDLEGGMPNIRHMKVKRVNLDMQNLRNIIFGG